ncbi:hypothetical protein R3W88_001131 [Solanum pinnatisectum]|uniref:Regulator of rDNA transcription protein 15 n=1 Tax=Solanum pinnatisectum TaxID=50273 RepID=A0AAV9MK98_9SOLN|nr:hypothetical protein R3W88_001131 [Solanum pinnatisectum]
MNSWDLDWTIHGVYQNEEQILKKKDTTSIVGGTNRSNKGLNLSGSWQQGHSSTYNTPSLLRVGKRTAGACVASSPDSDLEAFSHNPAHGSFAPLAFQPSAMTNCYDKTNMSHDGLNPAHVSYWWVNNLTLGEFCFTMIGRADLPSRLSCGNFFDTSSFEFRRSKGSLGHTFTVHIRTENQNQTSFYLSVPHEIFVLVELILEHLRYLLTDVLPQPNSPPDNVFRPDRPVKRALAKKRGSALLPIHEISKITLKVVVFHFRLSAPTYTAPLKSFHKVGLESSSTGSSFLYYIYIVLTGICSL